MSAEYSVGEVRAEANRHGDHVADMLTAYADLLERIKAGEGAVTYAVARKAYAALETEGDAIECMRKALIAVWPTPPAQADEGAPAGVTDALPVAIKACDEEMQRYGHKFAGAVAWYAMRAALLAVWPTPPAPVAQGESLERCDTCDGEGEVYAAGALSREVCSDCDGSGITAALAGRPHAVPDDTIRLDYLEAHVEPGIRSAVDKVLAAAPSPGESNNKPTDCSGDPLSCPDNEGRGCYCSDLRRAGESA